MKSPKASSSDPKATTVQYNTTTAGTPPAAEGKTLSTSTTATSPLSLSPTSQTLSHSRPHSFPFPFGRSPPSDAISHQPSRSRSKSPGATSSPPNSLPKTAPIPIVTTGRPSQAKRTGSDPEVSPVATSPATRPQLPKKGKYSPASTSHCGRHSNDWLFGGFSVTETVKGFLKDDEDK